MRLLPQAAKAGPGTGSLVPDRPNETILSQVRQGQLYANLDPISAGDLQLRVVVPVYSREVGRTDTHLATLRTASYPLRQTRSERTGGIC